MAIGVFLTAAVTYFCEDNWCYIFPWQKPFPKKNPGETKMIPFRNEKLHVITPLPNAPISSPLKIEGEARGTWYFEASFPIRLLDQNGKEIASTPAQAKSNWMRSDFVPFEATLQFEKPAENVGVLIFEKDNPSGLPEHAEKVSFPIRFSGQNGY